MTAVERDAIIAAIVAALPVDPDDGTVVTEFVWDERLGVHMGEWGHPERVATAVLAAVEPLIRADERKQICQREGHNGTAVTTLGDTEEHLLCARCGHAWAEPFECHCIDVADRATCPAKVHDRHLWREDGRCDVDGCLADRDDPGWAWHEDPTPTGGVR